MLLFVLRTLDLLLGINIPLRDMSPVHVPGFLVFVLLLPPALLLAKLIHAISSAAMRSVYRRSEAE